jgi:hypothetical protein
MKKHIALGAALLLTLSTAVASTFLYGEKGEAALTDDAALGAQQISVSTLAAWKATASTTDYITPKVPI